MAERITIQDIADELGLSRNTVSKAINNTGLLAETTRQKVLKKAVEMGYKQFSYVNISHFEKPEEAFQPGTDLLPISSEIHILPLPCWISSKGNSPCWATVSPCTGFRSMR